MVWDYLLTRYMFARYWSGKRRGKDDEANAVYIAARRNVAYARNEEPTKLTRAVNLHEAREALIRELKRGPFSVSVAGKRRVKSLGRLQAEADIAVLSTLPPYLFSDNFAGVTVDPEGA